ncbi:MAG: CDP-alcohol phosphatidyltransferase family protein [Planctomycetota bacterium]
MSGRIEGIREQAHELMGRLLHPLALVLRRAGVTANQVTVAGVVLNGGAAALILGDRLVVAGIVYLVAGSFDLLDGVVARLRGGSRFGAYVDSVLDRVSEGIVFAAIAGHLAERGRPAAAVLAVIALLGSVLISYSRARAEGLGCECEVGIVTRPERVLLLGAGLLFGFLVEAILVLVPLCTVVVIQRTIHTYRQLEKNRRNAQRDTAPEDNAPEASGPENRGPRNSAAENSAPYNTDRGRG